MGKQIIKQPNGLFAIFSDVTDTIHLWDATAGALMTYVEQMAADAAEEVRKRWRYNLEKIDTGKAEEVYGELVMTWQEAIDEDKANGGEVWKYLK